jgi:flagellar biosynthesis protein FliP
MIQSFLKSCLCFLKEKKAKILGLFVAVMSFSLMMVSLAVAQQVNLNMGGGEATLSANVIQFVMMMTVLSVAPGILMTVTCFPFMVTVLSLLRHALGVQQAPPTMVITSLAMFLTFFVMEPTFKKAWGDGIAPYMDNQITEEEAFVKTSTPFRQFMERRVTPQTSNFMAELAKTRIKEGEQMPLTILVPSFMITEIERACKIAFIIFVPFLIIDLVVSSLLMAMGMMMLPPALVSLPIKLVFFTLTSGWTLISTALVRSYNP